MTINERLALMDETSRKNNAETLLAALFAVQLSQSEALAVARSVCYAIICRGSAPGLCKLLQCEVGVFSLRFSWQ